MALKPPGCRFQLTPSRRATTDCQRRNKSADISTHALTEGDSCFFSKIFFEIYFNSRPHGGRRHSRNSPIVLVYFNSRPHGGRLQPVADQIHLKNFNSRPHGGRREKSVNFPVWLISTHALTEGDRNRFGRKFRKRIFQLTPSRRATLLRCSLALLDIFQLTPSRRATDPSGRGSNMSKISTHALTEGDRYRSSSAAGSNISTHALTEGDFSVPGFLRT